MNPARNTILFHDRCLDGFGAAWVAWRKFGNAAEYLAVKYGDAPPNLPAGQRVYLVDFCYPPALLKGLCSDRDVTVLDHHKTAKEAFEAAFPGEAPCLARFDLEKSGAMLAWEQWNPDGPPPDFIRYLQDRDLWKFELPGSREFSAALRSYPFDFQVWEGLFRVPDLAGAVPRLIAQGEHALRLQSQQVSLMCDQAVMRVVGGHSVPVANATVFFSEVGEELCRRHHEAHFSAYYFDRSDGKRHWGLRSRGGFDCSLVACGYGGGGHPGAAGFVTDQKHIFPPAP